MSAGLRVLTRRTAPPVVTPCVWPLLSGQLHEAHELWIFPAISDRPQPLCALHVPLALAYYAERLDTDPSTGARRVDPLPLAGVR